MKISSILLIIGIFSYQIPVGIALEPTINITMAGSFLGRTAENLCISYDGNFLLAGTESPSNSFATLIAVPESFTTDFTPLQIQEPDFETTQKIIDINNDGSKYIVNSYKENKTYCYSNSSTIPIWVNEMEGSTYDIEISGNGEYAIYSGHLTSGMQVGFVYTANGTELWHFDYNNILVVDTSYNGNFSIVGTWNGSLFCFGKDSSTPLWEFTEPNFGSVFHLGISGDGSTIFVADSLSDYLFVLDTDSGDLLWSGEILPSFSDVDITHTGDILVTTQYGYSAGNKILLFPRSSMTAKWEIQFSANGGDGGITADGKLAAIVDWDGNMMIIDCESGSLLLNQSTGDGGSQGKAVISPLGNSAAVLTQNGQMYIYNIDQSILDDETSTSKFYDLFLDTSAYPALGICLGVGLIIGGLIIGILKKREK